jgi:selenocysteine lyase/cysteine desulfurase
VDIGRIAAACRLVEARLLVDGVQAVGAVEVDASIADFYTASVFKWLLSGFGLAIMIARPDFEQTFDPLTRGYNNEPPSRQLRYSHMNYPGVYALCAALEYLESLGWGGIFERVERLATTLHGALLSQGFSVVTPVAACAGIISIAQADAAECAARLARADVRVEERSGLLRVSPHFYNSEAEIERFVETLSAHTR